MPTKGASGETFLRGPSMRNLKQQYLPTNCDGLKRNIVGTRACGWSARTCPPLFITRFVSPRHAAFVTRHTLARVSINKRQSFCYGDGYRDMGRGLRRKRTIGGDMT